MKKKSVWIGSDHGGYDLKGEVVELLRDNERYDVHDVGPYYRESVDYPEYARLVTEGVLREEDSFGILICGTGVGMSIVANKERGIRAVLAHNEYVGVMGRRHNDANVLCLGARVIGSSLGLEIVKSFLGEEFEGGRHARRVGMFEESCASVSCKK